MVKIILYLCQFWTCATTLTSCCRRKIKSYCSYSATVYNSLQTRVTWHSEDYCLLLRQDVWIQTQQPDTRWTEGGSHWSEERSLVLVFIIFPSSDQRSGTEQSSRWMERRKIKTRSIIITSSLWRRGHWGQRTEARLPINIYFVIINAAQLLHRSNY